MTWIDTCDYIYAMRVLYRYIYAQTIFLAALHAYLFIYMFLDVFTKKSFKVSVLVEYTSTTKYVHCVNTNNCFLTSLSNTHGKRKQSEIFQLNRLSCVHLSIIVHVELLFVLRSRSVFATCSAFINSSPSCFHHPLPVRSPCKCESSF